MTEAFEPDFDVIVVGAGPAGSVTAYRLAQQGLSVVLIERGEAPGAKNLSGGVLCGRVLDQVFPGFADEAPVDRRITRHVTTFLTPDSAASLDYRSQRLAANRFELDRRSRTSTSTRRCAAAPGQVPRSSRCARPGCTASATARSWWTTPPASSAAAAARSRPRGADLARPSGRVRGHVPRGLTGLAARSWLSTVVLM